MRKILSILLIFLSIPSFSALVTWTNGNATNNWNDPLNWSSGTIPGPSDIAVFGSSFIDDCSINIVSTVEGIDIQPGYTGTITQETGISLSIGTADFTQADGAFIGGDTFIDINGNFFLSGGTFVSTTDTLFIGENINANLTIFNHSGGTFTHNNGTIEFDPSCTSWATRTYTVDVIPGTEFNHVVLDANSSSSGDEIIATPVGDTLQCIGNLTHDDGRVNGIFATKGNLSIQLEATEGSGWFVFNGTGTQTYFADSGAKRTCGIAIDKPSGGVIPTATTTFKCSRFNQIQGDFTCPTDTLNIGYNYNGNLTIFNHTSGTFTHNGGTVEFDPSCTNWATRTYTIDVNPTTLFNHVILDANSTSSGDERIDTPVGDTVQCVGDLIHDDGSAIGVFATEGNLIINSEASQGEGSFIFNGTGAQTYFVSSGAPRTCGIVIDKPSGGVTPNATNSFKCSTFNQIKGDFTCPVDTLQIGLSINSNLTIFNHSSGIFNHNNGTVEFDPTCTSWATRTFTVDVNPNTIFNNIILDANSTSSGDEIIATSVGDSVKCIGNITHDDGSVNGIFTTEENLYINAEVTQGSGWFVFNGTGAQTYYASSGSQRTCGIAIDKPSGTVSPDATTTFKCSQFNQIQGDFICPTDTLHIGYNHNGNITIFNHSSGIFDHNNGTVEFDPSCTVWATRTYTIDVIPSTTFNHVILDANSSSSGDERLTTPAGDTVRCMGNLTHDDGSIYGIFATKGNLFVNAEATEGQGWLVFNGTGAQTYYIHPGALRMCGIAIDKTSGGVSPNATSNMKCSKFNQIQGDFTCPTGTMNVGLTYNGNLTIFTHTAGLFHHNNGTVEFDPTCVNWATRTYTIDVIPTTLFNNVTLNANSSSSGDERLTTPAGDTVKCIGNIIHDDGSVYGVFSTESDLTVNSEATEGHGWIVFNGSGIQTYNISGGSPRTCGIAVNKPSGNVTAGGGTTTFKCSKFNQTSGDFTCPTGLLQIGNNYNGNTTIFNHGAGVFSPNSGTIKFDPSCTSWATRTYTLNVIPSTTFNNLILDANSSSSGEEILYIPTVDTLDVLGDLLMEDGGTNGGWIACEGNVTMNSTFTKGNSPLLFKGVNNQNFDLTGATANHNNDIQIDKPSGNVTLLSILDMDAGTGKDLYLTSGDLITTHTNLLIIDDNVKTFDASAHSFVQGPMRKVGNDNYTFPTGKNDTTYAPIAISAPGSTSDHFTAEYFQDNPNLVPYDETIKDPSLHHLSRCEYWILDRTNGSSNVSVTLSWDERSCGVTNLSDLAVARWDGTMWKDHMNGGTTGTTTAGTVVSLTPVTSFSPFTIASSSALNPLPIELLSFEANKQGNNVALQWVTASEMNNKEFEVQHSVDGISFTTFHTEEGATNSNSMLEYSALHRSPELGLNYYRLKQVDFNGDYEYSSIQSVLFDLSDDFIIYPNPISSKAILTIKHNSALSPEDISLLDVSGRIVPLNEISVISSGHLTINTFGITAGTYLLQVQLQNETFLKRIVIE